MFCKYCGNKLSEKDTRCPACGESIAKSGGEGFRIIVYEAKAQEAEPRRDIADEIPRTSRGEAAPRLQSAEQPRTGKKIPFVLISLIALLTLALVFSLIGCSSVRKELRTLSEEHLMERLSLKEQLDSKSAELEAANGRAAELESENGALRQQIESMTAPAAGSETQPEPEPEELAPAEPAPAEAAETVLPQPEPETGAPEQAQPLPQPDEPSESEGV